MFDIRAGTYRSPVLTVDNHHRVWSGSVRFARQAPFYMNDIVEIPIWDHLER